MKFKYITHKPMADKKGWVTIHKHEAEVEGEEELKKWVLANCHGTLQWFEETKPKAPWDVVAAAASVLLGAFLVMVTVPLLTAVLGLVGSVLGARFLQKRGIALVEERKARSLKETALELAKLEADGRAADALLDRALSL